MPRKFQISTFIWTSTFFGILATLLNYQFGASDQIEQLPILYRTLDPDYLSNDFFTNNTSGFSPRFYYSKLLGAFSFIGVPWVFFLGTLLSNIATSVLTYLIGKKLFADELTGVIASALVMFLPTVALGGIYVFYASLFTPTTLVFPLVLLSFYLLLQKKILFSIMITGIVSLFHVLIGLEYGILFLSIYIFHEYLEHHNWRRVLKSFSLFLIIFIFLLPNLIPHFQNQTSIDSNLFIEILANFRHPHHYILSDILTTKEILQLLWIVVIIFLIQNDWTRKIQTSYFKKFIQLTGLFLAIAVLLGWIFVELIPTKMITSLQLLRMLNIGKWLFFILIANHFAQHIRNKEFNLRILLVIVLLGLLVFVSVISWKKVFLMGTIFSMILFLLMKEYKILLFAASAIITGCIIGANNLDIASINKYQKKYLSSSHLTTNQIKLVEFIRKNTSNEAVFLSPHLFGFMRTEAQRAIVVDYKAFPFKETAMLDWYHRIGDCYGLEQDNFKKVYKDLNDIKIEELQKKYQFDYAILYQETETKTPVIYSDSEYKIIDLTSYAQ